MKNLLTNLNKPCYECGGKVNYEGGGAFTPHIMYNPETGEPIEVSSPGEHASLMEQGFLSEAEMNQMAAGGQHMQNGMESMQKNINSHFKKLSKNRNNMFKDATAPMNQDTDSYGALKLDNFKSYVKQNVDDVMMQEALQSYNDAKGKIDMMGMEGAMANLPQGGPQQQSMYGGASNQHYAPGGAYNNGQGNFGMGNSNYDITPWANAYDEQLQQNNFNTGAFGSMLQTGAENIASNYFNPQYKTKTKTKLLFGDDERTKSVAKTDRQGNVKKDKDGNVKMTKSKIDRDWFGKGYTDDKGVEHLSRREDKKKYRQWKKGQRNERQDALHKNAMNNADNQDIFDARMQEQVGYDGDLSNVDMPTLTSDMDELLINTNENNMYDWKNNFGFQFGGTPEQYGGKVYPQKQYFHQGGNLPSHAHSGSANDMSDMIDPATGNIMRYQGYDRSDPSTFPQANRPDLWSASAPGKTGYNTYGGYDPSFNADYSWRNYGMEGNVPAGGSWDGNEQIPGVTGSYVIMPGTPGYPDGVFQTYEEQGNPVGADPSVQNYRDNQANWVPGTGMTYSDQNDSMGGLTPFEVAEIERQQAAAAGSTPVTVPGQTPAPGTTTPAVTTPAGAAATTVQEVEDANKTNKTTKTTADSDGEGTVYEKGVTYEWDGEKLVAVDKTQGQGNLFVPEQYGYAGDHNLYRGTMKNNRPRRGATPIAYDPSNTFLREYDYKTKTGLVGQAMGWGPKKRHTRMRFDVRGDAPWRKQDEAQSAQGGYDMTDINAQVDRETDAIRDEDLIDQSAMDYKDTRFDPSTLTRGQRRQYEKSLKENRYGGEQFPQAARYPVQYGYGGAPFPEQFPQAAMYGVGGPFDPPPPSTLSFSAKDDWRGGMTDAEIAGIENPNGMTFSDPNDWKGGMTDAEIAAFENSQTYQPVVGPQNYLGGFGRRALTPTIQRFGGAQYGMYDQGGQLVQEGPCPEGYVNNGYGCVPFQGNNSQPPQLDFNPSNQYNTGDMIPLPPATAYPSGYPQRNNPWMRPMDIAPPVYNIEPTRGQRYGGAQYAMGGTYEVSEDEVNAILAAGGQIEYL